MEAIKELIKYPIDKIWKFVDTEVTQIIYNRLLEYQVEEFNRNFRTKTILHRTAPVKLSDFYQPLFIRPFGNRYKNDRIPTHSIKELFADNKYITILGTAGSGKSTIVKYLLVNCIEEKFKIPIKIELRYLNKYKGSLFNYIEEEVFKLEQLAFDNKVISRLLKSGDFVFFFDGYDELSSDVKEAITKDINDFTKVYSSNYYLITSRPYTNVELLARFSNFEVCELNEEEIEQFVKKQIPDYEIEVAEKIIESVNKNNHSYKTFLRNPLLLSMFILTFQTYSNVPPRRSAFYRQVFDSLFHLHDSMSKLAYDREKKSGLSKEQFELVLKLFSFISFFKQVFVFEQHYINKTFNQIKENKKSLQFDNEDLIDDLQVAICILNKEGLDYVFPHRSLQEYFASLYIISLESKQKNEVYKKILDQFIKYDIFELITKDNFFTLLSEQDEFGVIKHLSIPFLEAVYDDIKQGNGLQVKEGVLHSLEFYVFSFHADSPLFSEIIAELDAFGEARHDLISSVIERQSNNKGTISFEKEEKEKLNELSKTALKKIKTNIPKIIKGLKGYLKEQVDSDLNIIDLV